MITTNGATHESQVYLEQIKAIENKLGLNIKLAIADRAYGSGEIIQSLINKQVLSNIALFSNNSGSNPDPDGFMYDKINNRYQCPAGNYLKPCPTISNNTMVYYSKSADCKNCDLHAGCTAKLKSKHNQISLFHLSNFHNI